MWFSFYWPTFVQYTCPLYFSQVPVEITVLSLHALIMITECVWCRWQQDDRQEEHMVQFPHSDPSGHSPSSKALLPTKPTVLSTAISNLLKWSWFTDRLFSSHLTSLGSMGWNVREYTSKHNLQVRKEPQMVLKAGGCLVAHLWIWVLKVSSCLRSAWDTTQALPKISVPQPGTFVQLTHIRMNKNNKDKLQNNLEIFYLPEGFPPP